MSASMPCRFVSRAALGVASFFICSSAFAQQAPAGQPATTATQKPAATPSTSSAGELDQVLVNLPTTLRLKKHKSYFRITHRFARDLRRGSFGQLAADMFSLDNGAIIGLEYRFGITDRIQAGVNRSIFGKTIDLFGRWDAIRQGDNRPIGLSALVSIEGQNNLRVDPQPGVSVTVSRVLGRLSVYATPSFIKDAHTPTLQAIHEGHSHGGQAESADDPEADDHLDQNNTAFVGLGLRLRLRPTVSFVTEVSPRVYGYRPDRAAWNVAIEKLTRGHVLQLNFGNSFGTTPGQLARGGSPHDVYMGFNLSRKF